MRLQFGGRIEYSYESIRSDDPLLTSLTPGDSKVAEFVPLSASAGLVYEFLKDTAAALTLNYSERAPTTEELYARGVHDATFQYLIGDPHLGKEKQLGVDLSVRRRAGIVTGALSGFYNRFYDFIDFAPEAGSVDGNRIFDYSPSGDFLRRRGPGAGALVARDVEPPGPGARRKERARRVTHEEDPSSIPTIST